jgi:murein DD-endopeptidase MepM/ murein hydrolase activator NlpD
MPPLTGLLLAATLTFAPVSADPVGVWPLQPQPEVVHGFDPPDSTYGAGHRGVDLLGAVGQPVLAALPGTITYAGALAGRGVVVVDHGVTRTTYEPVAATVSVGTAVPAGAQIGTLGLAGSHCFPRACLHWGWIEGQTYLDPLRLVGAGPVRLLPLWREAPVRLAGAPVGTPP